MGKVTRRKCLGIMIVPDKYWTSSLEEFQWITKESNAKTTT
jgi:hypothetical protein